MKHLVAFLLLVSFLNAANWLMIQGTEKKAGFHPWGFVQVRYENNEGDKFVDNNGINKTSFVYIKPNLENQSELQLARLRLGLRGSLDDDNKINYFLLTELAENGVNKPLGYHNDTYITDASVTFKQLPIYARIGMFKYAGSEEGNMARFVSPFINFTAVGSQLMLERFVKTDGTSKPIQGVGAYRDSGIQFFQTYKLFNNSNISLSYMLGNGSGLEWENKNDNHFTHYGYISYDKILGKGKGYKLESFKLYAWLQEGKRKLLVNNRDEFYDRDRYGLGFTYYQNSLRIEGEYIKAKGMILGGVKDTNSNPSSQTWMYIMNPKYENEADGYYLLSTYAILDNLEILARYDRLNRMTNNDALYRKFETVISGFSYIFKNYNRIDVNYAINRVSAPYNTVANSLLDETVGNLLSVQVTWVFK